MSESHDESQCADARHKLYFFLDGELTDDRRAMIQSHLESCPPCFEAYDFEAELRIVIAQKCRDRVPDALRSRIAHALQIEARNPGMNPGIVGPDTRF